LKGPSRAKPVPAKKQRANEGMGKTDRVKEGEEKNRPLKGNIKNQCPVRRRQKSMPGRLEGRSWTGKRNVSG